MRCRSVAARPPRAASRRGTGASSRHDAARAHHGGRYRRARVPGARARASCCASSRAKSSGSARGVASKRAWCRPTAFPVEWISIGGLRGKGALTLLVAPLRLARALFEALSVMRRHRPAVVARPRRLRQRPGRRRRVALPPAAGHPRAERGRRLHQSLPGAARAHGADRIPRRVSRRDRRRSRSAIRCAATSPRCRRRPSASLSRAGALRLLVVGGSLGARGLNAVAAGRARRLHAPAARARGAPPGGREARRCRARGLRGRGRRRDGRRRSSPTWPRRMRWADLVVCRAGALTIAELAAAGVACDAGAVSACGRRPPDAQRRLAGRVPARRCWSPIAS